MRYYNVNNTKYQYNIARMSQKLQIIVTTYL